MYFVVLLKNLISAALTVDQSNSRPGIVYVFRVYTVFYVLSNLSFVYINPLQMKHRLLYLKTQSVLRCKHFSSRL